MFKKLNIKTLAIIFVVLLGVVLLVDLLDRKKGERTFRKEIVEIDSAKVSSIIIKGRESDDKQVKIFKGADGWQVEDKDGNVFNADPNTVKNLISELLKMKAERVAATSKSKWEQFEVNDSLGSRVVVMKDNEKIADLVIGKFSYSQPQGGQQMMRNPYARQRQKMTSYVRRAGDDVVYAVDGFMRMTFRNDADSYKNKKIISGTKSDFTSLKFNYPADSSFTMMKQNDKWMVDGLLADSASVAKYLGNIAYTSSSDFAEKELVDKKGDAVYSLYIEGDNIAPVEVQAFRADTSMIVTSSQNKGSYFNASKSDLIDEIFIGKDELFASGQEE